MMMMAFDENSKHSFAKCELIRILSTTITRSNTEFAKLSFENIYNPITYINECYIHLWKQWADDKINLNDILSDKLRWDEWMINYYNNCKTDYFNTIYEMFNLMQFHTQSLKGDFSWIHSEENVNLIINHDGMVSTKLVNKLDYLLKKHNFGSLNIEPKAQKYRTRKRGGCRYCNQIRDVKRMLERQIDNEEENSSSLSNDNNSSKSFSLNGNDQISVSVNTSIKTSASNNEWKTTEVISSHGSSQCNSSQCGSSHCGGINSSNSNDGIIPVVAASVVSSSTSNTSNTNSGVNMVININDKVGYNVGPSTPSTPSRGSSESKTTLSSLSSCDNKIDSESEEYNLKSLDSVSCSDDEISKLLLLTPTPPPPGMLDLDDILSLAGVPNGGIPNGGIPNRKNDIEAVNADLSSLHSSNNEIDEKEEESSLEVGVTKLSQLSLNAPEFIFEKPQTSSIKVDKYFYDINTLFCNALNMRRRKDGDNSSYDSSTKERHFDVVNINQCQFGVVYEFDRPTVLCDIDENSYLYYIPREFLCNAKTASQLLLAVENLTNWDKQLLTYNHQGSWYTHDKFNFDFEHYNNIFGKRHLYPNWLKSIENKVLLMLDKFPQLSDIIQRNSPNSCLMTKVDNGNQSRGLYNMAGKYFNTSNDNYGSVNISLGATRTLAIGSMVRNQTFGINLRLGDIYVIAGKFDNCYKYGIPFQSNVNDSTMTMTFAKIDNYYTQM